jgi:cold-inducible RNA-binding protein
MTNIFAANLPYTVTEAELSDCFGQFGNVEKVEVIPDRATGQSRGFALVEMTHDRDAMCAIQDLNGRDWDGRTVTVRRPEDRPQHTRSHRTEQHA